MLCFLTMCLSIHMMATPTDIPSQGGYVGLMPGTQATVLVAHNTQSGDLFYTLGHGDAVEYDGQPYAVSEIILLQALEPRDIHTEYIRLENSERMSARQAADLVFSRPGQLVLLTCFRKDGDPNWGRYIVVADADPKETK